MALTSQGMILQVDSHPIGTCVRRMGSVMGALFAASDGAMRSKI